MQFGFGVMRLSSQSFWGLTPRELASAFEALSGRQGGTPDRASLEGLMQAYPDREARHG
jgi:uncharacterized phage protein (TIGR02216 family)